MTTETQGISGRVSNSKQLAKLIEQHPEWPADLVEKAERARLTLAMIESNPAHVIEAIKANAGQAWAGMVRDLMEFAEGYGVWKAREE